MPQTSKEGSGERTVAYACTYVPEEIILAAGLRPERIIPESRPSQADAHMHPNTCYYIKSLLASGLAGAEAGAAAVVFANSCDGMRRLHDVWSEYVEGVPALFLDVPKKKDPASVEFFAYELERFARELEETLPGARVTDDGLLGAIETCNEIRGLMGEVFRLQGDPNSGVSGRSVLDLCLEGARSHPAAFVDRLTGFISEAKQAPPADGAARRILVTANVVHRPELIDLVERSGGRVVALDSCLGVRHFDRPVETRGSDPMTALAERYLAKASCPRMEGIEERFQRLKRLAVECDTDGIIYSMVKFCDLHLYEAPLMRITCEDSALPFLFLENDYEWTGMEQMKTRVEAFLGMIGERGAASHG
jgi:benzoyl-CoA reductase/2-hydroxyglutaryl-CoA dehydratase subunit BcrC/BadD/HgdB